MLRSQPAGRCWCERLFKHANYSQSLCKDLRSPLLAFDDFQYPSNHSAPFAQSAKWSCDLQDCGGNLLLSTSTSLFTFSPAGQLCAAVTRNKRWNQHKQEKPVFFFSPFLNAAEVQHFETLTCFCESVCGCLCCYLQAKTLISPSSSSSRLVTCFRSPPSPP